MKSVTKVIAGTMGLSAFVIAVVAGLGAGNDASTVLLRALVAMAACHVVGMVIGAVAERTLDEHVKLYYAKAITPGGAPPAGGDKSQSAVEKSSVSPGAG